MALASIAGSVLGGTLAAGASIVAVDQLVSGHGDQRLLGAVVTLAGELDEELAERDGESVADILADENSEIAMSGIGLAVFEDGHRAAGERWVPAVAPGACQTSGTVGARVRACAIGHRGSVLVAGLAWDQHRLRWLYALAGLVALVVGAGSGALFSWRLTRWALEPLLRLTRAIEELPPAGATGADLGPEPSVQEVRQIRAALLDLLERSNGLIAHAQRFATDAAHELRTPLTTLRGELELLAEDARGEERQAIERASAVAIRLSVLLERLLILATSLEDSERSFEPVALADAIGDALRDRSECERGRVQTRIETEGTVAGDAALIQSMVWNILDNALKFAPEGDVLVELSEHDRRIRLDVIDPGPGIPLELRERVFEPFFRARSDASPGHGIGLALVGHIARAHGGRVEIIGAEAGTHLRVELPRWDSHGAAHRFRAD